MVRRNVRERTVGGDARSAQRVEGRGGREQDRMEEDEVGSGDGGGSGGGGDGGMRYPVSPCCSLLLKYLT